MQYKFKTKITFALLFVLSGCNNNNNQKRSGTKKALEFDIIQLKDLNGKTISLDI